MHTRRFLLQQADVVMVAAVAPETVRRERQRQHTEEDELDLYDVLARRGRGHVGTYESVMSRG